MNDTMTMTAARPAANTDCGCECGGGSNGECCGLECLVHPRFFCGQLLADQDLTALVDWVKTKSALARYRHGWGVVCGLDVHCGSAGTITISSGYALDCCGRDIVVCSDTPFELGPCWQRPQDPCANAALPPSTKRTGETGNPVNTDRFGFIPRAELQAVDVFVRYAESQSDSRTTLARGGCGGTGGCEYTRVHESFEIYCKPAARECEVEDDAWVAWNAGYTNGVAALRAELGRIMSTDKLDVRLQLLHDYLTRNECETFCFLREWVCYLQQPHNPEIPIETMRANLDEIAFWILQDWRNRYLAKPCSGCGPDTGLRLARVWIWMRRDSRGKEKLTTVYVSAHPPFRRALSSDEWQVPADKINLAPYVWQPVTPAMQSLRRAGIFPTVTQIDPAVASLIGEEVILTHFAVAGTAEPLTAFCTFDPQCGPQSRIVGFFRPVVTTTTTKPNETPKPSPIELTDIAGIGDGLANRLRVVGINNVADLASATPATIRQALGTLRVSDDFVTSMIDQAKANVS